MLTSLIHVSINTSNLRDSEYLAQLVLIGGSVSVERDAPNHVLLQGQ